MEDRCLKRVKEASGLSVFLMEELGDARLRCNQLKDYLDEANGLIEKSEHRDHFFEVAGHLLHGIPDTLMRMDKALAAAAMAVAKWDYEEIKEDLRPEKAEQLEDALKDVRVRRVQRKSSEPEASMKIHEAAEQLKQIAASSKHTGHVDTESLVQLIASLEGDSVRTASSNEEVAVVLRGLADDLSNAERRPSRLMLASVLRRVLGDTLELKTGAMAPLKIRNRQYGEGISEETFMDALKQAAENVYEMRGVTRPISDSLSDALTGYIARIGPLAGMPDAIIQRAKEAKDQWYELDHMCGQVAGSFEVIARDMKRAPAPSAADSRYDRVKKADALEPEPEAHYNMGQGFEYIRDAARLAFIRGSNGTQMRQAFDQLASIVSEIGLMCDSVGASDVAGLAIRMSKAVRLARRHLKPDVLAPLVLASDEKESRFEEGKPADPTKDMSEEDAAKWKENTDKYEDKFKEASAKEDDILHETSNLYLYKAPKGLEIRLNGPTAAVVVGRPKDVESAKRTMERLERYPAKLREMYKLASDERESRYEEGKPADPTKNMSEEDAEAWKANTDKYEDKFKAAGTKAKSLVPKTRAKKYSGDEKESRFEEGEPADPTENMSEADADEWKKNTDKYEDKFKSARAKQGSPGEVTKLIKRMNAGAGEKETYAMLEEAFEARKITQHEMRQLEGEAEEFFDPDYKTASQDPWKA